MKTKDYRSQFELLFRLSIFGIFHTVSMWGNNLRCQVIIYINITIIVNSKNRKTTNK